MRPTSTVGSLAGEPLEDTVSLTAPLRRSSSRVQSVALLLLPHGGQGTARRNAWAGMSRDAGLARDRRAAEAAVEAVALRAYARELQADGTALR